LCPGVYEETDQIGRPVSRWSRSDARASRTSRRRWSTWRWDPSPPEVFLLTRAGGMGGGPRIGLLARGSSPLAAFPRQNASVADSQPLPAHSCATAPDSPGVPTKPASWGQVTPGSRAPVGFSLVAAVYGAPGGNLDGLAREPGPRVAGRIYHESG